MLMSNKADYKATFKGYPDVLDVKQASELLLCVDLRLRAALYTYTSVF